MVKYCFVFTRLWFFVCGKKYIGDPLVHAQLFFVFQFRAMFEVFLLLTRIQSSLLFLLSFSWFLEMF